MTINIKSSHRLNGLRSPAFGISKRSTIGIICFAIPVLLLIGAYLHMAVRYEKIWLFNTIVHERGKYTLIEVIFYFRHFLWELPMKTVYAFMLVGIFYYFGKPSPFKNLNQKTPIPLNIIVWSGIIALLTACIAFFMAASELGVKEAFLNLCQFRASELRP